MQGNKDYPSINNKSNDGKKNREKILPLPLYKFISLQDQ